MIRLPPSRSLVWRYGFVLASLQMLAFLVAGTSVYREVSAFHFERTVDSLDRMTLALAVPYADLIGASNFERLQTLAQEDGERTSIRITIIQPDGTVIADSMVDPATMDNHRLRFEIEEAITRGRGEARRRSATLGTRMVYVARRIETKKSGAGTPGPVLRVAVSEEAYHAQLADVLRSLALAGIGCLGVTVFVLLLIARFLGRSVRSIAQDATYIARGELQHRVPVPSSTEFGRLAQAINGMADRLGRQIDQLHVKHNEQQAILQSMGNGVLALDTEQRILNMNRAAERLFDVRLDAVRGRLLQEIIREPDLHRFVEEAMNAVEARRGELMSFGKHDRNIQLVSRPLLNALAVRTGLLVLLDDVSELRRLESLRTDFAANVSHELRTPITNIKGYVETLLDIGVESEEQTRRFLSIVRANADRLGAIIEDLLALARLESPRARESLEPHQVAAAGVVGSVVEQYQPAAEAKNITLQVDASDDLKLSAMPQLLEQALANLLSNAIKFSPDHARVEVSAAIAADDDQWIEFTIADNGSGIPEEHLPRIFERFYRVDKARSRRLGGTGLGLAIVKHIALVHGGSVRVESRSGEGSCFTIRIPCHQISESGSADVTHSARSAN